MRLKGAWKASPNPKAQSHELHVTELDVVGEADGAVRIHPSPETPQRLADARDKTYPLQKKYHSPEYLRTMPHLRTRSPMNSNLLRLRSDAIAAATESFRRKGFTQTHPPLITSSDCEGAGEVFSVGSAYQAAVKEDDDGTFFRAPKYLTVSSQLHLEAISQAIGDVWALSPTFRAERSDTARHLSEFYMLEAEQRFVDNMHDVLDAVKNLVQDITKSLMSSRAGNELLYGRGSSSPDVSYTTQGQELQHRWEKICGSWGQITYSEAIKTLQASTQTFEHKPIWGLGLQAEHERYLANVVADGAPVFVTHYPRAIKPFYMLPSANSSSEGETVDCFDLLVPEVCEVVGGSMREHRLDNLIKAMQDHKMLPPGEDLSDDHLGDLKWYIDLRRWGSVPHGGFGLGFDRFLGYLSGTPNIREVVTFPRWVGRCEC